MTDLDRTLSALEKAYPGSLTTDELVEALYADRKDGGPAAPDKQVAKYINRLRAKGITIKRGYRLEKTEG